MLPAVVSSNSLRSVYCINTSCDSAVPVIFDNTVVVALSVIPPPPLRLSVRYTDKSTDPWRMVCCLRVTNFFYASCT